MEGLQITNPDDQVISLVNDNVAGRRRREEQRQILKQLAYAREMRAKTERRRAFIQMLKEAGACGGLAAAVLWCMVQRMIAPGIALPLTIMCTVWTCIRIDRYFRG